MVDHTTKQYVDQALQLAGMVAFAIPVPGVGPAIAAGIGGIQLVFDIIVGPGEPMPAPATTAQLVKVEQAILDAVARQAFSTGIRKAESDIGHYNNTLGEALGFAMTRTTDDPSETKAQKAWDVYRNKSLLQFEGTSSPVFTTVNDLVLLPSGSPQDYITIGAYTLAASIHIGFCKLAMLTEWNNEVDGYFTACDAVAANNLDWQSRHIIWQKAHDAGQKNIGAEPQPQAMPDRPVPYTILKGGPSFVSIQDNLPDFIAQLGAVLADYRGAFDAREKTWQTRLDAVQKKTDGHGGYYYVDTVTGHTSASKDQSSADDDYEAHVLQLYGEMQDNVAPYQFGLKLIDLTGVTDDDLKKYEAIQTSWQDALKTYPPLPAPTPSGGNS